MIETFVSGLLVILTIVVAIPIAVFCLETTAAILLPQRATAAPESRHFRGQIAVLIPAHDEGSDLRPTIENVKSQLRSGDRLLVVADNCTDDTAAVATDAGAEVVERNDRDKIGKGYALAYGLARLAVDPPDIVVMIDADCRVAAGAIEQLAWACAKTGRPAQALYLVTAPEKTQISYEVAQFAWRVKNWVRPLGLSALGLPCQLMGTGMAFPWRAALLVDFAGGSIVEDLKLGIDFAVAGAPALFCPSARVTSLFPSSLKGATTQRQRWEQGHIGMMPAAPRYFLIAAMQRNLGLLALALDLLVPPLSLLALLASCALAVAYLAALSGISSAATAISATSFLAMTLAVFLSWMMCGRDVLPLHALPSIALYLVRKIPLYRRILFSTVVTRWVRTDRK